MNSKGNKIHFWNYFTFLQWFVTITFFIVLIVTHSKSYGYLDSYNVGITLPVLICYISIFITQAYTFAIYTSGTPLAIGIIGVLVASVLEILFSILLNKTGIYLPDVKALIKFYIPMYIQAGLVLLCYSRIEFILIGVEDLQLLEQGKQIIKDTDVEDYSKYYL